MKVGIISDTHGSTVVWQKVMKEFFHDVSLIIHAGDVLYHGARNPLPEGYSTGELASVINDCPVPLLIARGNCDSEVDQMVLKYPIQAPYVYCHITELRIMVSHGHGLSWDQKLELAEKYQLNLFITGHTHIPVIEKGNNCVFLNPGSPTFPKNQEKGPTIAILEDKTIRVINIDSGETVCGISLE